MIPMLRRIAAAAVAAIAIPASATTYSTDFTDIWWNPAEDGWGVNLIQQYNTIFATFFVYGSDGAARWFVAPEATGNGSTFSSTLYQTTGPAFSATWNPSLKTVTPVGSATFSFNGSSTGTLSYTVNGVPVTKSIQRQSFRTNVLSGNYLGGMTAIASSCSNSADNGAALINGDLTIAQSGNAVSMIVDWYPAGRTTPARCTYNGTLVGQGRLGTITGTFSCANGATNAGNFTMTEVDASRNGMNATFQGNDQYCGSYSGKFGGLRDVI